MVMLTMMLVFVSEVPVAEEPTLEELCARYDELSEQLTSDYLALQQATIQSEKEESLLPEIKATSQYAKTRIAFKQVVNELGTRPCPIDMEEDFPPLL